MWICKSQQHDRLFLGALNCLPPSIPFVHDADCFGTGNTSAHCTACSASWCAFKSFHGMLSVVTGHRSWRRRSTLGIRSKGCILASSRSARNCCVLIERRRKATRRQETAKGQSREDVPRVTTSPRPRTLCPGSRRTRPCFSSTTTCPRAVGIRFSVRLHCLVVRQ